MFTSLAVQQAPAVCVCTCACLQAAPLACQAEQAQQAEGPQHTEGRPQLAVDGRQVDGHLHHAGHLGGHNKVGTRDVGRKMLVGSKRC